MLHYCHEKVTRVFGTTSFPELYGKSGGGEDQLHTKKKTKKNPSLILSSVRFQGYSILQKEVF